MDVDNAPLEFEGHMAHTAQAAPITVQWLIDNFEPAEGCSLRRSTLYNYYIHHCTEQSLEPVNPASFGKLIRSVFLGLRTRRLGTRGNSKYHYYGIRVKVSSPLNQLSEDHAFAIRNHPMSLSPTGSPGPHQPPQSPNPSIPSGTSSSTGSNTKFSASKRAKSNNFNSYDTPVPPPTEYKPILTNSNAAENPQQQQQPPPVMAVIISNNGNMITKTAPQTTTIAKALKQIDNRSNQQPVVPQHQLQQNNHMQQQQQQQQQQNQNPELSGMSKSSGDNVTVIPASQQANQPAELTEEDLNRMFLSGSTPQIPNFGHISLEHFQLPPNCSMEDVKKFEELYKNQCEKILDLVVALKLSEIENIWHMFWRSPCINHKHYEEQLSTCKFMSLCECAEVIEFTKQCDYQFYQFCIEILIPDVLGTLPPNLVHSIRQLAKHLDSWLRNALVQVPDAMRQSKMLIINTFSMTLRRAILAYLSEPSNRCK